MHSDFEVPSVKEQALVNASSFNMFAIQTRMVVQSFYCIKHVFNFHSLIMDYARYSDSFHIHRGRPRSFCLSDLYYLIVRWIECLIRILCASRYRMHEGSFELL